MDYYTLVILGALIGFLALAALLLVPVYRFLQREDEAARRFTAEYLRRQQAARPNGADHEETPDPPTQP
jgi:type II secretory pathway pseudopilin PulG